MGMTIEEARTALGKERKYALHENKQAFDIAIDTMRKYQKLQADYENRLKADLAAVLDELDLELYEQYDDTDLIKVKHVRQAIQQKIDKLKEAKDGENND